MIQAKGREASVPQVPGAFGRRPEPNHVARKTAVLDRLVPFSFLPGIWFIPRFVLC
jgi:hypothetical protein